MRGGLIGQRAFAWLRRARLDAWFGRRWPRAAELAEVDAAVVRREEVQEALVLGPVHVKQREQHPVAARGCTQAAADDVTEIAARDVPVQKQRLHVAPEVVLARDER